jgi:predicted nucleotidyltransferase
MTRPDLPDEVADVLDRLIASLADDLRAVYWHGSSARGEAKPWSDHDMIIVLRGRKDWSTFVRTEDELRQYPSEGRPQWHFGLVPCTAISNHRR